MATNDLIHCIYCGEQRPSSREHVLQRALGGNFTTKVVCRECNTKFSRIDQALAEDSLVALSRAASTPEKAFGVRVGGDHFVPDAESGLHFDARVVNRFRTEVLPQIHLVGQHLSVTGSHREGIQRLVGLVDERIKDGSLGQVRVKIGPTDKCSTARIVAHRSDDLYVRAPSEELAKQLVAVVAANWAGFKAQFSADPPREAPMRSATEVHVSMAVCLDDNYRAIAKTVFNFMADRLGSDFARRDEFADIRDYIRGLKIVHKDPQPDGEVAVDTRFVRQLHHDEPPIIPTKTHLVALSYAPPRLYGSLTLYGRDTFVVALGTVGLDKPVLEAHEFSIDRSANRQLTRTEIAARLAANPDK